MDTLLRSEQTIRCTGLLMMVLAMTTQVGCSREVPSTASNMEQPASMPPADSRSGVAALDIYVSEDRIHLLTAEFLESKQPTLVYSSSTDGGESWSKSVRIKAASAPHAPSRGNDPQIAAWQDTVMTVWTAPGTDEWGGGKLATALSRDGGRTWSTGPSPGPEGSSGGQYYIDAADDGAGAFHLVWLDDRDGKRGLRYARSHDGGEAWSKVETLDEATCECCWNTLIAHAGSVSVLYRNDRPRDMAIARSSDRGVAWQRPVPVGAFNWNIDACPHTGGGLARGVEERELHALVSTGNDGHAGLHHLISSTEGVEWSLPHRIGGSRASHPDLAHRRGVLVATWDEWTGDSIGIHYAVSYDNGVSWSLQQRLSATGVSATHPRVLATTHGFRVFWTERKPGSAMTWNSAAVAVDDTRSAMQVPPRRES